MTQGASAQLSLSMMGQAAQLSMALAPLSLSLGVGAAYGDAVDEWLSTNPGVELPSASTKGATGASTGSSTGNAVSDGEIKIDTSISASSGGMGPGSIAAVSAICAAAAVAVAATLLAKKRHGVSSASSTGSVSIV